MTEQYVDLASLYAKKTRTLDEAAQDATAVAAAERLPITANYPGDPVEWHRAMILKTVPVFGERDGRTEQVPASATLDGAHAVEGERQWTALTVKGADFVRYIEFLHSIW
jgi:hypothetical protein